jgi:hypothetical protein
MLRDNLAGLIQPMIDRAGAHLLGGHLKEEQTGGCSRSTELAIVALKRSWRQIFCWKTGRRAEKGKWPGFDVTTAAHDSRAVGTAQPKSHRTIDPQCLKKSPLRRGGIYALTENVASPFHAEPRQLGSEPVLFVLAGFTTTAFIQFVGPRLIMSCDGTVSGIIAKWPGELCELPSVLGIGCL